MISRDDQIKIMASAKERQAELVEKWKADDRIMDMVRKGAAHQGMTRHQILDTAARYVTADRNATHGEPERIWAFYSDIFGAMWTGVKDKGATEYIRADLVDPAYTYAKHLAETIFARSMLVVPEWSVLDDTLGVLTQIDHMVATLLDRPDPAAIREAALREAMVALDRIVDGYALREDFRAEEIAMRCHATILALIDKEGTKE